ncbi:hypothetical protein, partial [Methanoculleus sp. UBA413]|uniref:hypothetical protein n=1 Tax=Methanoculleus sp. UBA413 TaxID=1915509 RepID=UPI00257D8363
TPGRRSVTLEQVTLPDKRHLSVRLCAAARETFAAEVWRPHHAHRERPGRPPLPDRTPIDTISCEVNQAMQMIVSSSRP